MKTEKEIRDEAVEAVVQSIRENGRATTSQQGAEMAYDLIMPIVRSQEDTINVSWPDGTGDFEIPASEYYETLGRSQGAYFPNRKLSRIKALYDKRMEETVADFTVGEEMFLADLSAILEDETGVDWAK